MKYLIFVIALSPLSSWCQRTGILPYLGDKVTYMDTIPVKNGNFGLTAKAAYNKYVVYYNGTITQDINKLKDYVVYEDTSTFIANARFNVSQMMASSLFDGAVTFKKVGDSIHVTLTDIALSKSASVFVNGPVTGNTPIEDIDTKQFKGIHRKLIEQINKLFRYLH